MVSRIFRSPLLIILLSLAFLGIGVQLFTSPGAFFTSLFVTIGVITVLILLFRTFIMPRLMNRQGGGVPKQYKAAAKATQHKAQANTGTAPKKKPVAAVKKPKQSEKKKPAAKPLVKRSPEVQLTVIEGKKNKKKSRANS
ncbi:SA1362 family protein [Salisediminibacterium halotolerans]|uniref:Uncharacterized protein n=1 Tax=Salisediminibacterium halotolerans TaxID=517425 RepID=A0A1H9PHK7_9BACI|nr:MULTISPECIES: SA1362 family protein [Salisediminibacterium]RLJ78084.1 hypothetical protein BCL39_0550 [Actinophytocola xinjiangensis]RPE88578.1 hypothetical protein EDD67_0909 [Salisediminibacterium halotolerans]TWG37061.1 hypothetical protein BCL52_0549 [Salisediminibacterium halotolerans]SER47339.1 hypothetical protein SAMN05444126_101207 [Salisediminibacterium haloalkalitolerans]GEL06915.1 hypothetical protein SHA02_03310 [Salisediminibacterium halotolerans]